MIVTGFERIKASALCVLQVVLCGGSGRIPRLQQMIREAVPDVELLSSAPPDEVIAMGAALEAGLLVGRDNLAPEEESVTVDVSAADILVKVRRPLPAGSATRRSRPVLIRTVPCRRRTTPEPRCSRCCFRRARRSPPAGTTS